MKNKSILFFSLLVAIIAFFNFVSCHKYESGNDDYSEWAQTTEADSVIYAQARAAFLNDPANEGTPDFAIMQFLSQAPYSVRTKTLENGMNYQFACKISCVVTVYKGTDDKIGKVIEIVDLLNDDFPAPIPPDPRKRDTLIW